MAWELTYAELADRGVLLDLNTLLAQDKAFADTAPGGQHPVAVRDLHLQRGQYAFPEQWSGNYLFYNKTLFAEAGVHPPPGRGTALEFHRIPRRWQAL